MSELFPYQDFSPEQKLLALSLKQPYAQLMLHDKIETRTWGTKYRGWVMICASKNPYSQQQIISISGEKQFKRINELLNFKVLSFGHALAIGRLVDCRPMKREDEDRCFVEYFSDLYCHVYENVKAIEPLPWVGTQGWTEVPGAVKQQITFLKAA